MPRQQIQPGHIFLSYSSEDLQTATALAGAMRARELRVWQDVKDLVPGRDFATAIEDGIRQARALVTLVTATSARSNWVTYEYAFARGANKPVLAVVSDGVSIPSSVKRFQIIKLASLRQVDTVAASIERGILDASKKTGREQAAEPVIVAKFTESDGEIQYLSNHRVAPIAMELWIENAPRPSNAARFEVMDSEFEDNPWTVRRSRRNATREFLTDDFNSWGDVEIWAIGLGKRPAAWEVKTTLYEALMRHYRDRATTRTQRAALRQIREN